MLPEFGNIVPITFTPVLAKHSNSFCLGVGGRHAEGMGFCERGELRTLKGRAGYGLSALDPRTVPAHALLTDEPFVLSHTLDVFAVAVTPDGQLAVSASDDRTLKVWDIASGESLASFT